VMAVAPKDICHVEFQNGQGQSVSQRPILSCRTRTSFQIFGSVFSAQLPGRRRAGGDECQCSNHSEVLVGDQQSTCTRQSVIRRRMRDARLVAACDDGPS